MADLLTRDDWRRLERLVLSARHAAASPLPGRRPGLHRGYSVEFHDYRAYEPGDDPRDIDWTIYGRLDRLFLRLFRAESELTAHVLLDTSGSMRVGAADKFTFARKVAAAISYVVASNQERVGLASFASRLTHVVPPQRGRGQAARILQLLGGLRAEGGSDPSRALLQYGNLPQRRGLAIVITDGFAPDGCEKGLAYLAYRGFEVTLVHVLADEERAPAIADVVELVDIEGEGGAPLTIDASALGAYQRQLEAFTSQLERFCLARGIVYIPAVSSMPFDVLVEQGLRAGMWQPRV